jgi:hypothetical protein
MRVILILSLFLTACGKPESTMTVNVEVETGPVTIMLCPQIPGDFPQYIMKVPGTVYLVTSNEEDFKIKKTPPGDYTTDDGRNCDFTVTDKLEVVQ